MREETTHSAKEGVTESMQGHTEVKQKWSQRVEESRAHLNRTPGTRWCI